MKKAISLLFLFLSINLYATTTLQDFFKQTEIDIGIVSTKGKEIVVNFAYENKLKKAIVIKKIEKSCGCLEVIYPTQPIKSKEKGNIKVVISKSKRKGYFKKSLLVYATGLEPTILRIKGRIQ